MKIKVEDIYCRVLQPINHVGVTLIHETCRARPSGYKFMPKYRAGSWDGYISLMSGFSRFPTGLLSRVLNILSKNNIRVELEDNLSSSIDWSARISANMLHDITLRDYQVDAVLSLLTAKRGIAKMATNAGKTEVIAAILKALSMRSVVVVHRKELLHQTAERLEKRIGCSIGMVGDGIVDVKDITVAMIQTLSSRKIKFPNNKVVIADECHHVSSDQMMDIMMIMPGEYRFGFSGTPLKYDVLSDLKLIGATGDIVVDVTNSFMIDSGFSAKPVVNIIPIENDSIDIWESAYQDAYVSQIVKNDARNNKIATIAKDASGTTLILVERIDHGNILRHMIPGSIFVNGSCEYDYRRKVLDKMKKGGVFIATPIFDEGIDVPSIGTLIIACGGNSSNKLLQRLGRGLRQKEYDNVVKVFDFLDDTNQFLFDHSEKRINTFIEEGFEVVEHE